MDAEACRQQDEMSDAELLDRAMAFLTDCAAVGFADRLDDFAALVVALGWAPPQPLGLRNSAPAGEPRYQLSDAEREAVLERDVVDVQLVESARRQFGGLWDAGDAAQARKAWSANLASAGRRLEGELVVDLLDPIPGRGWLPVMNGYAGRVRWLGGGLEATLDLPVTLRPGAARRGVLRVGARSGSVRHVVARGERRTDRARAPAGAGWRAVLGRGQRPHDRA